MEEQDCGANIVLAILGVLLLLVITPIVLFLDAGDDDTPEVDPNAPCILKRRVASSRAHLTRACAGLPSNLRRFAEGRPLREAAPGRWSRCSTMALKLCAPAGSSLQVVRAS